MGASEGHQQQSATISGNQAAFEGHIASAREYTLQSEAWRRAERGMAPC